MSLTLEPGKVTALVLNTRTCLMIPAARWLVAHDSILGSSGWRQRWRQVLCGAAASASVRPNRIRIGMAGGSHSAQGVPDPCAVWLACLGQLPAGKVTLDGVSVAELDPHWLVSPRCCAAVGLRHFVTLSHVLTGLVAVLFLSQRGQIGFVGQDPVLFNASIRENITYARSASQEVGLCGLVLCSGTALNSRCTQRWPC